ncbi:MAG: septum formation initiator family protein [Treponemataceae bacterium]
MLRKKFIISSFVGTLVYVFVSVFFGPTGTNASRQLEEQGRIISTNVQKLQNLNDSLSLDFLGLRSDAEVVKSYAKRLGYISSDNERLIKISGLVENRRLSPESGFAINLDSIDYLSEQNCKIIGLIFFALAFLGMSLFMRKSNFEDEFYYEMEEAD